MNFKVFTEAKQELIDQLEDSINKVSERPFNELFDGKERFLVRVYNPKFHYNAESCGFDLSKFNFKNRTYEGKNLNTVLRTRANGLEQRKQAANIDGYRDELAAKFIKEKDYYLDMMYIDIEEDKAFLYYEEQGDQKAWYLLNKDQRIIFQLKANKYVNTYPIGKPLNMFEIKRLFNQIIRLEIVVIKRGEVGLKYSHELNAFVTSILHTISNPVLDKKHIYDGQINRLGELKQTIDQENMFYYLLFSRHPIDVLRMSDHKGISSCHRLDGRVKNDRGETVKKGAYSSDEGMYGYCAVADAQNSGGIVYIVKGKDGQKIKSKLNDREVFEDRDRNTGDIKPLGRIRLRRYIDLQTGKDFAVPTMLQPKQKYGLFTKEIYDDMLSYLRDNQPSIYKHPPDNEYAQKNIVVMGGDYTDEDFELLLNNFFGKDAYDEGNGYSNIKHVSGSYVNWGVECETILNSYKDRLPPFFFQYKINDETHTIDVRINYQLTIPVKNPKANLDSAEINQIIWGWMRGLLYFAEYGGRYNTLKEDHETFIQANNILFEYEAALNLGDPQYMEIVLRKLSRDSSRIRNQLPNILNKITKELI